MRYLYQIAIVAVGLGTASLSPAAAQEAASAAPSAAKPSAAKTANRILPADPVPSAYQNAPADAYREAAAPTEPAASVPPHPHQAGPVAGAEYPTYGYGPYYVAQFDREAWLNECRARTRNVDDDHKGSIIGGLLGAITGGIIGNRVWDSERTLGTVLGAGAGGLAGAAIGNAVEGGHRKHGFDCAAYLDRYMAGASHYPQMAQWAPRYQAAPYPAAFPARYPAASYGYGYGNGCGCAQPVMMVKVREEIPQRAVVREEVHEEWVKQEPPQSAPPPSQPAPRVPAAREIPPKGKLQKLKPIKH